MTNLVRKSKQMYFQQSIDDNKGNPKEIWKALKSGMVFVDFRKAFDIVDHQLLLMKLHLYRVSDPSLSWFESYLSGRQQFVSIDSQRSDSLLIKQGVPQGSVLGPAPFLLFVNDIPLHLTDSTVDIYADNTTITQGVHFSDLCSMTPLLNSNLDVVQRWASCKKMFINKKKNEVPFSARKAHSCKAG